MLLFEKRLNFADHNLFAQDWQNPNPFYCLLCSGKSTINWKVLYECCDQPGEDASDIIWFLYQSKRRNETQTNS